MCFTPFSDHDSRSAFRTHTESLVAEICGLENEFVRESTASELEQSYLRRAHIEPLKLHSQDCYIEEVRDIQIDRSSDMGSAAFPRDGSSHVNGTQITVAAPFEGDERLWKIRPSSRRSGEYPAVSVDDGVVRFFCQFANATADGERLNLEVLRGLGALNEAIESLRRETEEHNGRVAAIITDAFRRKRQEAETAHGAVGAIRIPIKQRDPPLVDTPLTRRPTPGTRHRVPSLESKLSQPELAEEQYQHILSVISSLSLVIECNPASFATLDEGSIRDHILLVLNAHYEGAATGETFNRSGKTDILIRVDGRNIFIAECKFWSGPSKFKAAIDQLLSYLTWRDCKCALVVFYRGTRPSVVADRMNEAMSHHPECHKVASLDSDGTGRYIFAKQSDPGRDIIVTTLLFNVPSPEDARPR
jgi:hypothetical protein